MMSRTEILRDMAAHGIPMREASLSAAELEAVEEARREAALAALPLRKACAQTVTRATEAQWRTTEQRTTGAEGVVCTTEPDGTTTCRLRLPADVTPDMVQLAIDRSGGQR